MSWMSVKVSFRFPKPLPKFLAVVAVAVNSGKSKMADNPPVTETESGNGNTFAMAREKDCSETGRGVY